MLMGGQQWVKGCTRGWWGGIQVVLATLALKAIKEVEGSLSGGLNGGGVTTGFKNLHLKIEIFDIS